MTGTRMFGYSTEQLTALETLKRNWLTNELSTADLDALLTPLIDAPVDAHSWTVMRDIVEYALAAETLPGDWAVRLYAYMDQYPIDDKSQAIRAMAVLHSNAPASLIETDFHGLNPAVMEHQLLTCEKTPATVLDELSKERFLAGRRLRNTVQILQHPNCAEETGTRLIDYLLDVLLPEYGNTCIQPVWKIAEQDPAPAWATHHNRSRLLVATAGL